MKKKIKPICGNCKLYDPAHGICRVIILHEGEKINIPVDAEDSCFYKQQYFDPISGKAEDFNEIQEVKFWVEDDQGKKINKDGTVKVEYPKGFFGLHTINDILG